MNVFKCAVKECTCAIIRWCYVTVCRVRLSALLRCVNSLPWEFNLEFALYISFLEIIYASYAICIIVWGVVNVESSAGSE